MRITSTFHDFYDCVQALGQDQSLIYIRKPIDKLLKTELPASAFPKRKSTGHREDAPFPVPGRSGHRGYTRKGELPTHSKFYVLGVTGKIYPIFELIWDYSESYLKTTAFCYNISSVQKAIEANCNEKARANFSEPCKNRKDSRWALRGAMKLAGFENFFEEWESSDRSVKLKPLFKEWPTWVLEEHNDGWHVQYNCCLKDYKFYKIMGALETFQEISMFLGGLAVPQKPIPVPSDKDMVGIKGFDKYSFRKDPKQKKPSV
jgi:hypothetical protein